MTHASRPGTASPQQRARLVRAAEAANVRDAHLIGLARRGRIIRNANAREHGRPEAPALATLDDLSMFETSDLIKILERAATSGDRSELAICLRCVRLGFAGETPCQHDARPDEINRLAEIERARGLRSW